ncbi:hypothetical protein GYA93_16555 [Gordonia desulfuricans]|uniref:Uncharacterized protein n=1 Tax=Gordonia desulfuricans TaxID=89051 RepID=A0A7K3LSE5_9ACTN|nr:hypothetical protein [Gordonia desulfuricans]NDK91178.1 hypothetical protein [Gordonia desulfuricans]
MAPFSDDDLEEFYRRIEILTDLTPTRRAPRRPAPIIDCPTPYKDAFVSEGTAREGIDRIRQAGRRAPNLRCYHCRCGRWHITSSPPRDDLPRRVEHRRGRRR